MSDVRTLLEYAAGLGENERDLAHALTEVPWDQLRDGTVSEKALARLRGALASILKTFDKIERKDDLWALLHEIPGSHVEISCDTSDIEDVRRRIDAQRIELKAQLRPPERDLFASPQSERLGQPELSHQIRELRADLASLVTVGCLALGAAEAALNGKKVARIYPCVREAVDWADILIDVFCAAACGMVNASPHCPVVGVAGDLVVRLLGVLGGRASAWKEARIVPDSHGVKKGPIFAGELRHLGDNLTLLGEDRMGATASDELAPTIVAIQGCFLWLRSDLDELRGHVVAAYRQFKHKKAAGKKVSPVPSPVDFDTAWSDLCRAVGKLELAFSNDKAVYPRAEAKVVMGALRRLADILSGMG